MKRCLVALLPATLLMFSATSCARKQERLTRAVVTGEANVQAQPDTAVLVISVVTQHQRALDAQRENARKSDAVIQAVQTTAGANPEVRTNDYKLQPQYSYRDNRLPSIIGYEARNSVMVRMNDLNDVGAVIDAASRAGANSIESVSFILREGNPMRSQTLAEATRQAMNKAQSMAQALNGRVVRVVEEHEGGAANPEPETSFDARAREYYPAIAASVVRRPIPTPVEAGSLNVRSQVRLIVEIEAQQ